MARRTVGNFLAALVVSALALSVTAVVAAPAYAVDPVAGASEIRSGGLAVPAPGQRRVRRRCTTTWTSGRHEIAGRARTTRGDDHVPGREHDDLRRRPAHRSRRSGSTSRARPATWRRPPSTSTRSPSTGSRPPSPGSRTRNVTNATLDKHKIVVTPAAPVEGQFTTVVTTPASRSSTPTPTTRSRAGSARPTAPRS